MVDPADPVDQTWYILFTPMFILHPDERSVPGMRIDGSVVQPCGTEDFGLSAMQRVAENASSVSGSRFPPMGHGPVVINFAHWPRPWSSGEWTVELVQGFPPIGGPGIPHYEVLWKYLSED